MHLIIQNRLIQVREEVIKMNKEEHFLTSRFLDLANVAYERSIYTYTDFLNLNEISILESFKNQLPPVKVYLSGGNNYAERKIAIFSPAEIYYEESLPIEIIEIAPINPKYADILNHRDFLGAILSLGINRNKIGDILVRENKAYVYCISDISDYIIDHLKKIKHTLVDCKKCENSKEQIVPSFKNIKGTVANIRLDSLIATAFNSSRSSIISFIEGGKVFVNGKLITSNGYQIKENDIVSVRGKGRFVFRRVLGNTKKGRNVVSIDLYI